MAEGINIDIATSAITAIGGLLGGGGLVALFQRYRGKRRCEECPDHLRLERRVELLERESAANTALLESIDKRLASIANIILQKGINS